jgi:molecular chaperone GrpE
MVVRDKRRVDSSGKVRKPDGEQPAAEAAAAPVDGEAAADPAAAEPTGAAPTGAAPTGAAPAGGEPESDAVEGEIIDDSDPVFDQAVADLIDSEKGRAGQPFSAELGALRAEVDDRTRDLQRITAEYANYRKRVDRDRGLAGEQATASVLAALLPILDDLDRAREHGDLTGPFASMADALTATLGKFGLTAFGEKGDPFDPTRHEAVAHLTSPDVTESSCIDVMRRGYLLGDRLVRPAMVAVADPVE